MELANLGAAFSTLVTAVLGVMTIAYSHPALYMRTSRELAMLGLLAAGACCMFNVGALNAKAKAFHDVGAALGPANGIFVNRAVDAILIDWSVMICFLLFSGVVVWLRRHVQHNVGKRASLATQS